MLERLKRSKRITQEAFDDGKLDEDDPEELKAEHRDSGCKLVSV